MKEKANMFIQRLNKEFGNILQKVRLFSSIFSYGRLLEASILPRIVNKIAIFSIRIGGGGCLLEHGHLIEILQYIKGNNSV